MKQTTGAFPAIDDPFLTLEEAQRMPEFAEGVKAAKDGKRITDCPYAIFNLTEFVPSTQWREEYENKFHAWMHGFNS